MDPRSTTSSTAQSSAQPSPSIANTNPILPPAPQPLKTPSTDVFLKDFTLLAEATKRAEMAVLMRDLESVGLS